MTDSEGKEAPIEEEEELEESPKLYYVDVTVVSGSNLIPEEEEGLGNENKSEDPFVKLIDSVDAYCEVSIGGQMQSTKIIPKNKHPVWNERLEFVFSQKPKKMDVMVINDDVKSTDDLLGNGEFFFGAMFETQHPFQGSIRLSDNDKERGFLRLHIKCSLFSPLLMKRQLSTTRKELSHAQKEKQTMELTYQHKLDQMQSHHSQEIFIYEQHIAHAQTQLTNSNNRLQKIDMNYTKAHNHLKHQLHQLRLKQAAKDQQLTNMEKEILKAADKVLQTEHSQTTLQQQLAQTQQQAQSSIQQLSQTRSIVLQQAQELQEKANSFNQQLTSKEQQILDAGKKLAQITEEMECAKIDYHQKQHELDALKEKLLDYHHKLQQQQDAPKKQQEDLPITLDNTQKQQPEQTTTTSRGFTDESAAISQNDFDYGGHMMGCGVINACDEECTIM